MGIQMSDVIHLLLAPQDSVAVVRKFMETAGGDINFNLIALAPPSPYD
jgi:hypothetical protein